MRAMQDTELVVAARQGDASAYGELFERYEKRIYNFAYGILGNTEDARDCTQDAFIRVYEALPKKEHLEFQAYLYRTTRNLAYDTAKSRGRFTEPDGLDGLEESGMYNDPVRSTLFSEQQAIVRDAVASLPEEYRAVLMLREVQELSYQEIADALDMPRNTVGVMIMRARLKFKGAFRMSHVDVDKLASECQAMLPKLSAYIDDELKPGEREKIDAHLDGCPLCRLALDEMREASKAYRGLVPLIPPLGLKESVLSRLQWPGGGTGGDAAAGKGAGDGASGAADGGATKAMSLATKIGIGAIIVTACCLALSSLILFSPPSVTRTAPAGMAASSPTQTALATAPAASVTPTVGLPAEGDVIMADEYVPDVARPPVPEQISPADGARVPQTVDLKWTAVRDQHGVTYSVELQQSLGGGAGWETVAERSNLTGTTLRVASAGMMRRWRVWVVDGEGVVGPKSPWWSFVLDESRTRTPQSPITVVP